MQSFKLPISLGRLFFSVLLLFIPILLTFFTLYYIRLLGVKNLDFSACANIQNYQLLSECLGRISNNYLFHPNWQAVQFACYTCVAIAMSFVVGKLAKVQYRQITLITIFISFLILFFGLNPNQLVAGGTLFGGLLGFCIVEFSTKNSN